MALPLDAPAVKATESWALAAVILLIVGADGVVNGVPDIPEDAVEVPAELIACKVTV